MIIARMNRASMPVEAATDLMLDESCVISASELLGTSHCAQELDMMTLFASNLEESVRHYQNDNRRNFYMASKDDTQLLIAGQPSETSPVPPYTV